MAGEFLNLGGTSLAIGKGVKIRADHLFHALPDGQGRATHDGKFYFNAAINRPCGIIRRNYTHLEDATTTRP